jgi:hypothetical protein
MPEDDRLKEAPVISPARFSENAAENAEYRGSEGL